MFFFLLSFSFVSFYHSHPFFIMELKKKKKNSARHAYTIRLIIFFNQIWFKAPCIEIFVYFFTFYTSQIFFFFLSLALGRFNSSYSVIAPSHSNQCISIALLYKYGYKSEWAYLSVLNACQQKNTYSNTRNLQACYIYIQSVLLIFFYLLITKKQVIFFINISFLRVSCANKNVWRTYM